MAKVFEEIDYYKELKKIFGKKKINNEEKRVIKLCINNLDEKYYYNKYYKDTYSSYNLFEILIYNELYEYAEYLLQIGFDINYRKRQSDLNTFYNYMYEFKDSIKILRAIDLILKYEPSFKPIEVLIGNRTFLFDPLDHIEEHKNLIPITYKIIHEYIENNNLN